MNILRYFKLVFQPFLLATYTNKTNFITGFMFQFFFRIKNCIVFEVHVKISKLIDNDLLGLNERKKYF